jgi:signal transduction histidine kinase
MVNYLVHYTEEYLGHAGVNCQLDVPFEFPSTPVSAAVRHNLFMATQEGLNNAVKHARPSQVCLRVVLSGNRLAISLEDDGCGFDPASALAGRNGLENMRQRLESVGGKFQLASAPGRGTRIHFDVALGAGEP